MQQKFLEEKIGAHRKSKKALSAKQRTAKKAGREFPEEDTEQLKHVTEQQGVVQKQLEQVRSILALHNRCPKHCPFNGSIKQGLMYSKVWQIKSRWPNLTPNCLMCLRPCY